MKFYKIIRVLILVFLLPLSCKSPSSSIVGDETFYSVDIEEISSSRYRLVLMNAKRSNRSLPIPSGIYQEVQPDSCLFFLQDTVILRLEDLRLGARVHHDRSDTSTTQYVGGLPMARYSLHPGKNISTIIEVDLIDKGPYLKVEWEYGENNIEVVGELM